MSNILADKTFITEFQLLEVYHSKRNLRSQENLTDFPCRVPATQKRNKSVLLCATSTNTGEFADVTDELAHIVDSVPLAQIDFVEDDNGSDDLIQRLVDLLKKSGDELNEKIQKDRELLGYLQNSFSYTMFEKVVSAFIGSVVPAREQNEVSEQKTQIAWTFEMTSRLRALDLQPMNRVMGFGAQYLHQHFAPWIQQHGGWDKVFNSDDDVQ